jgi:hypothetical protein
MIATTVMAGCWTGAKPAKLATYAHFEYRPVAGSTFSAVPFLTAEV